MPPVHEPLDATLQRLRQERDAADRIYEQVLLLRCQAGDGAAFAEVVARYAPWVNRLLVRAEEQVRESAMIPYAIAVLLTILRYALI